MMTRSTEGRADARPSVLHPPTLFLLCAVLFLLLACGDPEESFRGDGACATEFCATQLERCRNTPDCLPLLECRGVCSPGDGSCHGDCLRRFPNGLGAAEALTDCLTQHCTPNN